MIISKETIKKDFAVCDSLIRKVSRTFMRSRRFTRTCTNIRLLEFKRIWATTKSGKKDEEKLCAGRICKVKRTTMRLMKEGREQELCKWKEKVERPLRVP